MSRVTGSIGLAVVLYAAGLPPAQATDCRLQDTLPLKLFATKPDMLFNEAAAPVITRSYSPGQAFTVKTGEVLLRRQANPAAATARFATDIVYRTGMPLSPDYVLKAATAYRLLDVPRAPALKALPLPPRDEGIDEYLFLDREGHLCESVMVYKKKREFLSYRAGSYTATPDAAAQIAAASPDGSRGRGDALVLGSIDAAAIELISHPSVDGVMGEAVKQGFDRQKTLIEFAGYTLRIDAVGADALTLAVLGEPAP